MKKVSLFALLSAATLTLNAQAQSSARPEPTDRKASQRRRLSCPLAGSLDARPAPSKR